MKVSRPAKMEEADDSGEPFFRVAGVRCKAEKQGVRMGMQLPSRQRVLVKLRVGEDRACAVRRHHPSLRCSAA